MTRRTAAAVAGSLLLNTAAVWALGLALRPVERPDLRVEVKIESVPTVEEPRPREPEPARPAPPPPPPEPETPRPAPPPEPESAKPAHQKPKPPDSPPIPRRDLEPPEPEEASAPPRETPVPEPAPAEVLVPEAPVAEVPEPEERAPPVPGRTEAAAAFAEPLPRDVPPSAVEPPAAPAAPAPSAEAVEAYYSAVRARIEAAKKYPAWARRRGVEGRVTVAFRVGDQGDLIEERVAESSGSAILDEAALKALRRAAPYPIAPGGAAPEITVALVFALR